MELNIDSAVSQLATTRDWLRWAISRFREADVALGHGCDTYWNEAVCLVSQALYLPPTMDERMLGARLTMPERYRVAEWIQRRVVNREPLPYIAQTAWQHGVSFYVDQRVLIPRSPIAQMLGEHLSPFLASDTEPSQILDMCTGCGALAILAALVFEDATVDAVDISADALTIAAYNIGKYSLDSRIRLIHSDQFSQIPAGLTYDLILCNPPYVDEIEMANLPPEYRFEPTLALAAGADGLDFLRSFLEQAARHLKPEGKLVLEVGNSDLQLQKAAPDFEFIWVEVDGGAQGLTVLDREECLVVAQQLASKSIADQSSS